MGKNALWGLAILLLLACGSSATNATDEICTKMKKLSSETGKEFPMKQCKDEHEGIEKAFKDQRKTKTFSQYGKCIKSATTWDEAKTKCARLVSFTKQGK